ncbi:MAG: imidazole glycerol phosphate synthase subunit HisH [Sphingobacteriaceae bacterium]|nr:imidazole glycerol phosphate synthase subunit HisH [Sphingobacteriaceae bacterium]
MNVVIIKYNAGNVRSVSFALERLGVQSVVSDIPEIIAKADKVIFPGVGEASTAMRYLKEKKLDQLIVNLKQPVLGICLGMQLMCAFSEEGNTDCLKIFDQKVLLFKSDTNAFKVPQMGWNNIENLKGPLFNGIKEKEYMYFVHGFYVEKGVHSIATTDYILPYSSALQKNNFYAVQFHPEKSAEAGQKLITNFLNL